MVKNGASTKEHPGPADLLHYNEKFQVIICTKCKYAIQPTAITRHLRDTHQIFRGARRPYVKYAGRFTLACNVPDPAEEDFPIPHLAIQKGLKCEAPRCDYLCLATKRMAMHWSAVHNCKGETARDWSHVPLQTFFQGTMLRYFAGPRLVPANQAPKVVQTLQNGSSRKHIWDALTKAYQLDDLDTVILHHYLPSCYQSFLIGPEAEDVWLNIVPQLACQHKFVLQGILSFTAQHMIHLEHPRKRSLILRALSHKDAAFPAFRHALEHPSRENCDAIFVFAYLLLVLSLGAEATISDSNDRDPFLLVRAADWEGRPTLPQWVQLLRSGCAMLGHCWQYIMAGPVEPLLKGLHPGPVGTADAKEYVEKFLSFIPTNNDWSEEVVEIYSRAADELAIAFASSNLERDDSRTEWIRAFNILGLFPLRVDDEFLSLLAQSHPAALLLMAHYCVLLGKLDSYWYFKGRAARLFTEIEGALQPQWHPLIRDAADSFGSERLAVRPLGVLEGNGLVTDSRTDYEVVALDQNCCD